MKTRLTRSPRVAAEFIRAGEVVAFPTETVFGLGAALFSESAIEKVFIAKGRPSDNPLIAHVSFVGQIEEIAATIPPIAHELIEAFFPGPLTLVLPRKPSVPKIATAGLETVGVRMPTHQLALEFIRESGTPLVAPSANLSGRPSPTTWEAVKTDLDGRIACILQGEQTHFGIESTVVDCSGGDAIVLRAGALTIEDLRRVIPRITQRSDASDQQPVSPGLKHRHYSPAATVRLVSHPRHAGDESGAGFIGLTPPAATQLFARQAVCLNVSDYAYTLFQFFRACDEDKIRVIYCERVEETGLGVALMDRLRRASRRD
ncbi:MAG: L-threonylcarbamoyladenylate synthase [Acidobacteriota bacterium]